MAGLPYIQLYPADYLADTIHLTLEQHGAYMMLIFNYWQRGEPPKDDDLRLAAICRTTQDDWIRIRPFVSEFFDIHDGRWYHPRIEKDLATVNDKVNKARMAGKASAKQRADK